MSSPFYPYFDPNPRRLQRVQFDLVEREPAEEIAIVAMRDTVTHLRAAGKRVVVAPPPSSGIDLTHCLERKATGSRLTGRVTDCNIPAAAYLASKAGTLDFLLRLERGA